MHYRFTPCLLWSYQKYPFPSVHCHLSTLHKVECTPNFKQRFDFLTDKTHNRTKCQTQTQAVVWPVSSDALASARPSPTHRQSKTPNLSTGYLLTQHLKIPNSD